MTRSQELTFWKLWDRVEKLEQEVEMIRRDLRDWAQEKEKAPAPEGTEAQLELPLSYEAPVVPPPPMPWKSTPGSR